MRLSQAGASVNEKWIISITGRLTYGKTTGMSKPIAWTDYEIFKSIIRMQLQIGLAGFIAAFKSFANVNAEIQCDKMAGYLLGGTSETALAIVLQKLGFCFIGATYSQRAAIEMQDC